jgi:two-component system, NarL family, invasion response regulator UvrY
VHHVVIADDHPLLRRGIVEVLRGRWPQARYHEADDAAGLFHALEIGTPDLVILDLSLPDRHGLDCLAALRRLHPQLPVLVLSMHDEQSWGMRVLDSGAMGYLTKERAPTELVSAVDRILRGRRYVGPELGEILVSRRTAGESLAHEQLSEREFRVLQLLARGESLTAIAAQLFLSPKTITTYRARLLTKLGLRNNAELVRYCVDQGLVG